MGALALGDLVKSTLGPKGMNKILQSVSSGDINVTNDGAGGEVFPETVEVCDTFDCIGPDLVGFFPSEDGNGGEDRLALHQRAGGARWAKRRGFS